MLLTEIATVEGVAGIASLGIFAAGHVPSRVAIPAPGVMVVPVHIHGVRHLRDAPLVIAVNLPKLKVVVLYLCYSTCRERVASNIVVVRGMNESG